VRGLLADMGIDDADELNESLREQIRSTAMLQLRLDQLQAKALGLAGEINTDLELAINRTANTLKRWMLGIAPRRRQDLGPEDALAHAERVSRSA
jgi:hypothetical protein